MKVIGAGLPRTATTTQAIAFEKLGFGHCYHMRDLLMDMETGLALWESVARGEPDWDAIFGDAQSTVDWPGGRYYKELLEYYPDSRVVLSVRSPEGWVRSMRDTIWPMYFGDSVMHHMCAARALLDPLWRRFMDLIIIMLWDEHTGALPAEETFDDAGLAAVAPLVEEALAGAAREGINEVHQLRQLVRRTTGRWVSDNYRRRPMIIPVVVEV